MRKRFLKKGTAEKVFTDRIMKPKNHMENLLKEASKYRFSKLYYARFKKFLVELYLQKYEYWPTKSSDYPKYPGMPPYTVMQIKLEKARPFIIIKFGSSVILPDGRTGKSFRIGGFHTVKTPIF